MAKSTHSKRRKRNQSIKRTILYRDKGKENMEAINLRLRKRTEGRGDEGYITRKKNAFRHPTDSEAIFPQQAPEQFVDKRQSNAPAEILIQAKGMKTKKLKKQNHLEALARNFAAIDGNQNEGGIIDMNKMANLDEFGNIDFKRENGNTVMFVDDNVDKIVRKKEKGNGMDIEIDSSLRKNKKDLNFRMRRNKKKKSSFLVNY